MSGEESVEAWFAGLQPCASRLRACRLCACSSLFRLLWENGVISLDSRLTHDLNRIEYFPAWMVGSFE